MNRTERLARLLAQLPPYEQFREERSRIAETSDEDPREERKP
jgi:hypothetical protein